VHRAVGTPPPAERVLGPLGAAGAGPRQPSRRLGSCLLKARAGPMAARVSQA